MNSFCITVLQNVSMMQFFMNTNVFLTSTTSSMLFFSGASSELEASRLLVQINTCSTVTTFVCWIWWPLSSLMDLSFTGKCTNTSFKKTCLRTNLIYCLLCHFYRMKPTTCARRSQFCIDSFVYH